jgi:hypothetical protein
MIETILKRQEFVDKPPVLLDIGAAESIHPKWRILAPYSICIAFDADNREMDYIVNESNRYKKLYVYNRVVSSEIVGEQNFYLTRSSQCSSLLRPQTELLKKWDFSGLFDVENTVQLKSTTLTAVLHELHIDNIDWFKSDSQGTDLRLFKSLGDEMIHKVLAAEFEPGILDAYEGEDKLWSIIAFMEKKPFWMSDIIIRGTQRFNHSQLGDELSRLQKLLMRYTERVSPGWGELMFLNNFNPDASYLDKRDHLLGWVIAMIDTQYGFAAELAVNGYRKYNDSLFLELKTNALRHIKRRLITFPFVKVINVINSLLK